MAGSVVFLDTEISTTTHKILDIGALRQGQAPFHSGSVRELGAFLHGAKFLCGHNILHHDLKYLAGLLPELPSAAVIDTLYLSPLLFPKKPYHALLKDDKLQVEQLNNPLNDCKKAASLFFDEVNAFRALSAQMKQIFCGLLYRKAEFQGFFRYVGARPFHPNLARLISQTFAGKICANADLRPLLNGLPVELAYALALIDADDASSITPRWVLHRFPQVENVLKYLRGKPCKAGCAFCRSQLDIHRGLRQYFGFDSFRTYGGEPLQQNAVQAAVDGKSLLAVFPTGGGKSLTFQLPALMAGRSVRGLTVVISPLQSLMKDQVDNLARQGIADAVTVNGMLDPLERAEALERVANGSANLLYISPELLRSHTIESLLLSRNIARFVVDEAHCFSAWGQDFRVDYLYIGDFIRQLQEKKQLPRPIPVSCFTATAKQKVITDICDYFQRKLGITLSLFATTADRENLHYTVLHKETDEDKYATLRDLISQRNCPTIVYVARTRRCKELAEKLTADGFPARPFYGRMEASEKVANQEAFLRNEVKVIVATSAFGMGVDKKDVELVVHFDISSSLEDYVQEAGRAGRDPNTQAECFVLFNDNDLDQHFVLLNQTKLSISEIQQVWRAVKELTHERASVSCSPLEIARKAGWDDSVLDIETRVKTALASLESAGYLKRGRNMPHIYATGVLVPNMEQAAARIDASSLFSPAQREPAKRIIKSLISSRSVAEAGNGLAESRVDYIADFLGLTKQDVVDLVNRMRQEGILADSRDMTAYVLQNDTENRSSILLERFNRLERFLLSRMSDEGFRFNLKQLNEQAQAEGIAGSSVKNLRTLLYYHTIRNNIKKQEDLASGAVSLVPTLPVETLKEKQLLRIAICRFVLAQLYSLATGQETSNGQRQVSFSLVGLHRDFCAGLPEGSETVFLADVEDALLFLSKIGALRLEGGFLVLYNGMEIKRLVADNRIQYKREDYRLLDAFYKQKIQQIHIVGEYANLMVRDYQAAMQFVRDYFQMDFRRFIAKYFKGERAKEIDRNVTPQRYHTLFDGLSETQSKIIGDAASRYIVVAAGPGSGKTRILVHKLASLLLLEDVKQEQILMLTFSRAAATEFKKRLFSLIGGAAAYVEIKTFHSYCFDLLGRIGNLDDAENVVQNAADLIRRGEVEQGKITKSVLVIDEAQDMDRHEFDLVLAMMQANEEMRVIAVGDDDQNIYEFRGSSSQHLRSLVQNHGATAYEMTENYRSRPEIVAFGNAFLARMENRMKSGRITAVQPAGGSVCVTRYASENLALPVVRRLMETRDNRSCCVLTNTNEEALQLVGLLQKNGVRAKLIQSVEGSRLYNLVEVRYFLRQIDRELATPTIPDSLWSRAKRRLFETYATSSALEICQNMIRAFESTNRVRFRSDLEEFLRESNYEDFYESDRETVFVSTIHKAKGREFDTVHMMLCGNRPLTEEEKRKLYVGMTRAKQALFIHCNTALFHSMGVPGVRYCVDDTPYEPPQELALQLTHRDVYLDFFKDKKELLFSLRSGDSLHWSGGDLFAETQGRAVAVARLSKACLARLETLQQRGYQPHSAGVSFVVAWKGVEDNEESAVLLPLLRLKRALPRETDPRQGS